MEHNLFKSQIEFFSICSLKWMHIDKQRFLISHAGNDLVPYPVKGDSFKYDAYSYYCSRMLFFAEEFIKTAEKIFNDKTIIEICKTIGTNERVYIPLASNTLFYNFDAFIMSVSTFTDNAFYKDLSISQKYKDTLNDESMGYSFKGRISVIRNRAIHPDGAILMNPDNIADGVLIETKSDGLAVFENGALKIQHTLPDVKKNPELYAEWKNHRGDFFQRAVANGTPLNTATDDFLDLFLSISEDAHGFFNEINKAIADNKGLNALNTGKWFYKSGDSISYDDAFSTNARHNMNS